MTEIAVDLLADDLSFLRLLEMDNNIKLKLGKFHISV
jgi:hypothetical protein